MKVKPALVAALVYLVAMIVKADLATDYLLLSNQEFKNRVTVAVLRAANDVRNEDPQTANHAVRLAWAGIITNPQQASDAAAKMVPGLVGNGTIAAAFAAEQDQSDVSDNDILFVVNSLITTQAQAEFPEL